MRNVNLIVLALFSGWLLAAPLALGQGSESSNKSRHCQMR